MQGTLPLADGDYAGHVVPDGGFPGELEVNMGRPSAIFLFSADPADDIASLDGHAFVFVRKTVQ